MQETNSLAYWTSELVFVSDGFYSAIYHENVYGYDEANSECWKSAETKHQIESQ